jgi:hypothetical protein
VRLAQGQVWIELAKIDIARIEAARAGKRSRGSPVHLTETTEVACPALVARGVTGARDMGGDLALIDWMRDRIRAGDLIGPTIFRAGPFVDGAKPGTPYRLVVSTEADGRRAADFLRHAGVDFIKTHTATPRGAYFGLLSEAARGWPARVRSRSIQRDARRSDRCWTI